MTEVTVEAMSARDARKYLIENPGKQVKDCAGRVYKWNSDAYCFDTDNGIRQPARHDEPYEAIVVEKESEWVEVVSNYRANLNDNLPYHACASLSKAIAETLKAQRIRIHNVDGSVTEYERDTTHDSLGLEWRWVHHGSASHVTYADMQAHIQLAFMRGSKVEVLR